MSSCEPSRAPASSALGTITAQMPEKAVTGPCRSDRVADARTWWFAGVTRESSPSVVATAPARQAGSRDSFDRLRPPATVDSVRPHHSARRNDGHLRAIRSVRECDHLRENFVYVTSTTKAKLSERGYCWPRRRWRQVSPRRSASPSLPSAARAGARSTALPQLPLTPTLPARLRRSTFCRLDSSLAA